MKTEKEKMLLGERYRPDDPELASDQLRAKRLTRLFNETNETEFDKLVFFLTSVKFGLEQIVLWRLVFISAIMP